MRVVRVRVLCRVVWECCEVVYSMVSEWRDVGVESLGDDLTSTTTTTARRKGILLQSQEELSGKGATGCLIRRSQTSIESLIACQTGRADLSSP